MSIYRAQLRNVSNLLTPGMYGEQIHIQVPPKCVGVEPADYQAVNARLLIRRQKMHGSQRCYSKHVELTVDDIGQIADAGDQELWRLAHSSRRGTLKFGAEDNNGLSQPACTSLAEE